MARPRKPTNLLILSGTGKKNPARIRERENEPINPYPIGECPEILNQKAQCRAWDEIVSYAAPGVLYQSDRIAVEIAARLLAKVRSSEASACELSNLLSLLGKFGMTPSDRAKLNLGVVGKKNKFAED